MRPEVQQGYLQDFIDFVNEQDGDRVINHAGWCNCAIGDWLDDRGLDREWAGARWSDTTILSRVRDRELFEALSEADIAKLVMPEDVFQALNAPCAHRAHDLTTYGGVAELLAPYDLRDAA